MLALQFLLVLFCVHNTISQTTRTFRKDYTYLNATESFYKFHTIAKTWQEAKARCELEGAQLFYAVDEQELNAVIEFWNQTQPHYYIYIGISDLLVKEVFETINGNSILDVYGKWGPGEPNDAGGVEDCVVLARYNGLYNDDSCDKKFPFICKKSLSEITWSNLCDMPRSDYIHNAALGRCYKVHIEKKNWNDAYLTCNAEQSCLAVLNSNLEHEYLKTLTMRYNQSKDVSENVLLGFHKRSGDWRTIKNAALMDSGFSTWRANQPDSSGLCGAMHASGGLDDVDCAEPASFICEHEIEHLAGEIDSRFNDLLLDLGVRPQDSYVETTEDNVAA